MLNNTNTNPVGFFDSGVGGLSVLARFRHLLPNENVLYFGDTVHLPYGNKTKEELISYARNILTFMAEKNVKAVVVACNTSSAQAYDTIKDEFSVPIYPIIQSCAKVIASQGYKRIGIFATEATVKSGKYKEELLKYNPGLSVKELSAKNWVGIVEKSIENIDLAKNNIKNEIEEMMKFSPDRIILGCTHYPYLLSEFEKYAPKEIFIDPAEIFAEFIKNDLEQKKLINNDTKVAAEDFYVSSNPKEFAENAKIFYDVKKLPLIKN